MCPACGGGEVDSRAEGHGDFAFPPTSPSHRAAAGLGCWHARRLAISAQARAGALAASLGNFRADDDHRSVAEALNE